MKTAFIFPAFITEFLGTELSILEKLSAGFPEYLTRASKITGEDYTHFSTEDPAFTENELRSQIISYTFGCCLSDTLISKGLWPDSLAGYSMGLYAALYAGKAIGFDEGVKLIEQAFYLSKKKIDSADAGMGSVIGLTTIEIEEIIHETTLEAEIANINSKHAHLVTGRMEDIKRLLERSRETGALHVALLPVNIPYHSRLLAETHNDFRRFISDNIAIQASKYTIISSIDQRQFTSPEEISRELTNNLFQKLNWQATFETMLEQGVRQFVECGAGKSLHNISRFMPGDFKVYPMHKVKALIT
jgi:[acyl-carrier-protein] S-malonyltransferase